MLKMVFALALSVSVLVIPAHASLGNRSLLSIEEVRKQDSLVANSDSERLRRLLEDMREQQERANKAIKKWEWPSSRPDQ